MFDDRLLPKLSQNLLEVLKDKEYCDIIIEVGNDPYKNDGTLTYIKLPNISPEAFEIILRYIYSGSLSLDEYDNSDIIKTLFAASELSLLELITYLQSFLIDNKADWLEQNFDSIYQLSFENDSFLELQKFCTDLMTQEPNKIFNSPNFTSITERILISIIQNDNLQMSEIQIWEQVIKWGHAQNPELPFDVSNYSKDDFNTLKNTLQQIIPFIRFYNLSSKEFMDKVLPYEQILPKELYQDLLKTFLNLLDPNSKPSGKSKPRINEEIDLSNIDSNIINYKHVEFISKWIDRLEITDKLNNQYEFKLLYRGSRDGFTKEKFHRMCDNKPRTVTIVKVRDSNEILGGYNPIKWRPYGGDSITKDSFIFSFNNNNNNDRIEKYILSRVIKEKSAIFNDSNYGPFFGYTDLIIWGRNGNCSCSKVSYEKPIRETKNFHIDEIEIFQIV
ncbi:carbohydrate-binding module family 13 protein [Rhizophagus clarus]|uniref:Carbohydrate-binding module family 13 protein n=1 Tax=Rhizophagus clarus TaxID=94130 RepID=A0A8H3MIH7_9GLOM|nr:carbohydrate-binding module family 13 protein [Rhizophagus clarus]